MKRSRKFLKYGICSSSLALLIVLPAHAYTFNTSPNWDIEWDTNLSYSLGMRADKMNGKIANNPVQQNDEYKFPNVGNITSSRVNISSELSVAFQHQYGADVSIAGWKDFAYNGGTRDNPGMYAPGVPYSALSSSQFGHYSSYTNRFYNLGAELENAFVFANFNAGTMPVSVKIGRFTEYWGTALFSGFQAISYGQSPIDIIKAVDAPGTEVADLFLPRNQISIHIQPSMAWTIGFQYQLEYRDDRFPEGGTFLGVADPFFVGPQSLEGQLRRGKDYTPPNVNGNFGVELLYAPISLNGEIGLYFRQFDDPAAYSPYELDYDTPDGKPTYHLAYAQHVHLYGASFQHSLGTVSAAIEASLRTNTGLNTIPGSNSPITDPLGHDGARGQTFNVVANALVPLTPTALWQAGSLTTEIAWTRLVGITHDKAEFNGIGTACGGEVNGCATKDEVNLNVLFDPQWLQVFPGVDIDAPISINAGLYGNGQTLALAGTGDQAGSIAYSVGVHALIKQKYNVTLDYTGYHSPTGKLVYTPSGKAYYGSGSGQYMWNDKSQIQLVLSTAF